MKNSSGWRSVGVAVCLAVAIAAVMPLASGCQSKAPKTTDTSADTVETTQWATIKGTSVNVRRGPSIDQPVIFQLNKGDKIEILSEHTSLESDEGPVDLVLTAPLNVYVNGKKVTLPKGTAVKSTSAGDEGGDLLIISFKLEGKTHADSSVYIEDIRAKRVSEEPWYQIKTEQGKIGWVYGDYIVM